MKTWDDAWETISGLNKILSNRGERLEAYLIGGIGFRYMLEKTRDEGEIHQYRETNDIDLATHDILTVFELAEEYDMPIGRNGTRLPTDKFKETRMMNPEDPETYVDLITDHPLLEELDKERDLTVSLNKEYEELRNLDLYVPNPDQLLRNKKKAFEDSVSRSKEKREHDLEDAKILKTYRNEIVETLKEEGSLPSDYEAGNPWPELDEMGSIEDYDKKNKPFEAEYL
ncbi:MAG: hypothetical protein ACLFS3_01660 [Candidatus Aenigmatarchaeota archaeon]